MKLATLSSIILSVAGCALATTASAHHSSAMYDHDVSQTSDAVVNQWQFSNPHATLWVYINNDEGKPELWGIEAPGPKQLLSMGWDKNTVQPGDKVTVTINPLRNGQHGGSLVSLVLSDGTKMGMGGGYGGPPPSAAGDQQGPPPAQ